jgi:choline dehydrogenase-like flavoprotein
MFIDAHTMTEQALEADICIAGAGAAGMTMALDLRASGLSVILLESGGFRREAETQRLSDGRMIGINTWNMRSMRIRALGGTTGHWEGWCRPLMPLDFESRDFIPNSGWPIRYSELLPWYARACETLEIGPFQWDAQVRAKAMGTAVLPTTGDAIEHRYYQFSPPTRFARVYGGALEKAESIRVVAHANVADVQLDQRRGRVESLICRTLAKTEFRVQANRYVLALGGIENPRVLLAARSQHPEGVANGHDVVGRYFMEHPHYYGSVGIVHLAQLDRRFYARMPSDLKRANGTSVRVMGAFGLTADAARSERLLNFSAAFHPAKEDAETGGLSSTRVQALLTRGTGGYQAAQLAIRAEQSPLAESRVSLTEDVDALGMPRAALDWRIAAEDDIRLHRALVLLGRELGASGIARTWLPGESSRFVWRPSPGGHHLGTTRMGTDPRTSVVDGDCRTHQIENLYVAGSSVFPTGGEANPTLTIVALAHRLADTLKRTV